MISLLKITRPPRARRLPLARGGSLAAWAKCCACSGAPSRVVAVPVIATSPDWVQNTASRSIRERRPQCFLHAPRA
jgi:hypothetical protein